MIVCQCRVISDKDIDKAIQDDEIAKRTKDVYRACAGGQSPRCGSCIPYIQEKIEEKKTAILMLAAE